MVGGVEIPSNPVLQVLDISWLVPVCQTAPMTRRLVLMGSGETSPTMVTPHQQLLSSVERRAGAAAFLDSTYGFEDNADALSERITGYFAESVGRKLSPINLRHPEVDLTAARTMLEQAEWIFAGPGSPTYALKVWQASGLGDDIAGVMQRGTLVLASAAALTVGTHTLPVYEIYKVGESPSWREGMNWLEAATGLRAAVIPHFDNTEGRAHDTRFCFMGERRLALLEEQLPEDVFILGVDEHTGVEFDLEAQAARVFGKGGLNVRKKGAVTEFESGSTVSFADLAQAAGTTAAAVSVVAQVQTPNRAPDPREPLVAELVRLRNLARAERRFAESDAIRDLLTANGVAVEDGAEGTGWRFVEE